MAALVPKDLAWISSASLRATGEAVSIASPQAVFAVLADHEAWTTWFPNVKKVEVLGPAEGIGARRRVKIPMVTVDEEFIAWEPGVRFAFTGLAASPRFASSLVEDCRLEPTGDGGCRIGYTMYFEPAGPAGAVMKVSIKRVAKNLQAAMDALARVAAR